MRKQLQERKIKFQILFLARLKIFERDGKFKLFDNPKITVEGLHEYGISMEISAKEPADLESTLQAAGWETAHSKSRRKPASVLMCGVKTLLNSIDLQLKEKD